MTAENRWTILMADDDEDDCLLAQEALEAGGIRAAFSCVGDGIELLNALACPPENGEARGLPSLILLDLNMPRKDGRQALLEIKANPILQKIPIIILTTSQEERDMAFSRKAGADSFVTKPATFGEWVAIMKNLADHWLG